MNDDQLSRIEELFHLARLLSGNKRRTFLAQSCGEDQTLRSEVESLLVCSEQANSPFKFSVMGEVYSRHKTLWGWQLN